jgi:hypothetical protein
VSDSLDSVHGVLLLYFQPLNQTANTVNEHVDAFGRYSKHRVWKINTELGLPPGIERVRFDVVVLHYSVFYKLPREFIAYLRAQPPRETIAFFQDEHHNTEARRRFIEQARVTRVYSVLELRSAQTFYSTFASVRSVHHTLTGYVSREMVEAADRMAKPDAARTIDIGYRARQLPYYMGRGAQEKHEIGVEFARHAAGLGLTLDIATDESSRLYGRSWHRFLANCRGILGVESGVSIFDLPPEVRQACDGLVAAEPTLSFDEVSRRVGLDRYENNVFYRTISPRHFEASAFRVCQILFEGAYQDILQPDVHYIPLRKDFSNFEEVVRAFRDPAVRARLTNSAHRDVIASERYSYRSFIEPFDKDLESFGIRPAVNAARARQIERLLGSGGTLRLAKAQVRAMAYRQWPGKSMVQRLGRKWLDRVRAAENPMGVVG